MAILEEIEQESNCWIGSYGPLLIVFWRSTVEARICRRLPSLGRDLSKRQRDGKIAVLSIALPTASPPDAEGRKALASLLQGSGSSISRVAVVREGSGFVASTVASIVVGIQMLAKPSIPHKAFNNIGLAIEWVAADLGRIEWSPQQMQDAKRSVSDKQRDLLDVTVALGA